MAFQRRRGHKCNHFLLNNDLKIGWGLRTLIRPYPPVRYFPMSARKNGRFSHYFPNFPEENLSEAMHINIRPIYQINPPGILY